MNFRKIIIILAKAAQLFFPNKIAAFKATICHQCHGKGLPSKAYKNVTAYTAPDEAGNQVIVEGAAKLVDVLKCEDCGHSWAPAKS